MAFTLQKGSGASPFAGGDFIVANGATTTTASCKGSGNPATPALYYSSKALAGWSVPGQAPTGSTALPQNTSLGYGLNSGTYTVAAFPAQTMNTGDTYNVTFNGTGVPNVVVTITCTAN
jgi:hypothetical protein